MWDPWVDLPKGSVVIWAWGQWPRVGQMWGYRVGQTRVPVVSWAWGSGREEQGSRLVLAVSLKQLEGVGYRYDTVLYFGGTDKIVQL